MSRLSVEDRFWSHVDKSGDCWLWTAYRTPLGYGHFGIGVDRKFKAHRFAYELVVGPIPEGLVIDHLCRNPACVNPDHLEPVTQRENVFRGRSHVVAQASQTHCQRGHLFTDENTTRQGNKRGCRTCRNEWRRERYRELREAGLSVVDARKLKWPDELKDAA